jgi:serine/threonine-protein kinase
MQLLFAKRIATRKALLEQLLTEDISSALIRGALKPETSGGYTPAAAPPPDATDDAVEVDQSGRPLERKVPRWIAAVAAAAATFAIGAAVILATAPAKVRVVEPVPISEPERVAGAERLDGPELATLLVETEPAGAVVELDGEPLGVSPRTFQGLSVGTHALHATLEGYAPVSRTVQLTTAGERSSVLLMLSPKVAPEAAAADSSPKIERGRLSIDTTPWSTVFLEGKALGDTPLVGVSLPAGKYKLKLVSEDTQKSKAIDVEILPGKTTVKNVEL